MPFKSEKQRRYLWANEPEIARDWTDNYGSRIKKAEGGVMSVQGGVKNYLGDQKTVSGVPIKWKSGPNKPDTELAYITKAEKDLILKKDIHGSLKDGPNTGPGGIMSLDSQGDKGTYGQTGQSYGDRQTSDKSPEVGDRTTASDRREYQRNRRARAKDPFHGTKLEGRKDLIEKEKGKEKRFKELAQLRNIKPTMGHWLQKFGYNALKNDPTLSLQFLSTFKEDDPEAWENLPQELKNLIGPGTFGEADPSGMDLYSSWKDHPELSFENWNMLTQVPGYGEFLSERGKPGVLHRGNVGGLGDRFVKKDKFGNVMKDKFGNTLYGYHEPRGGDGPQPLWMQQGYPSLAAWQSAQGGGGGGTATPATTTQTTSPFQQSLNTGVTSSVPYYVGANPTAANLAWGQQFNVDPRTMYRTTWADGGPIRQRYFLGKIVKKIGRAAKKVIKSPLGKAGLLAAGAYFGPMAFGQSAGFGSWGNVIPKEGIMANLFRKAKRDAAGKVIEGEWGGLSPWKIGIGAASLAPFLMGGKEEEDQDKPFDYEGAKNAYLNEIMNIKRGAMAGTLDPNQFNYLGVKDGGRIGYQGGGMEDPLLVEEYKKYVFEMEEMGLQPMSFEEFRAQAIAGMASGGRAGYYAGGQSIPSEYTMEDARKTAMQDRLGGITEVMKQADLYRQGDIGQMYMANGGVAGMREALKNKGYDWLDDADDKTVRQIFNSEMGTWTASDVWRPGKQEGGIMDLGGVEKDYRETGGFVPIGKEEKADDVPARLSLNEFVMTADAVRGMGDGDIDKGAERMEDLMDTLEVKGKKNQGAQDMFEVSERLSAVV